MKFKKAYIRAKSNKASSALKIFFLAAEIVCGLPPEPEYWIAPIITIARTTTPTPTDRKFIAGFMYLQTIILFETANEPPLHVATVEVTLGFVVGELGGFGVGLAGGFGAVVAVAIPIFWV